MIKNLTGLLLASFSIFSFAQGALENPANNATDSGIGIISGWHCSASRVEAIIDGKSAGFAYVGSERQDTSRICGKSNTGFALLINFNNLSRGSHNLKVYANGVLFGESNFQTTQSGGTEYLTNKSRTIKLADFPSPGSTATLAWIESKQSFVIIDVSGLPGTNPDPKPDPKPDIEISGVTRIPVVRPSHSSSLVADYKAASDIQIFPVEVRNKIITGAAIYAAAMFYPTRATPEDFKISAFMVGQPGSSIFCENFNRQWQSFIGNIENISATYSGISFSMISLSIYDLSNPAVKVSWSGKDQSADWAAMIFMAKKSYSDEKLKYKCL